MKEKRIQISKFRNNLNKIAKDVAENKNSVIIESLGHEYVAVIPIGEYNVLKEARAFYTTPPLKVKTNDVPKDGIFKFYSKGILPKGVKIEDVEELAKTNKVKNYKLV